MGPFGPTTLRYKADTTNVVLINEAHSNKVNGDFTIFKNSLIANDCPKILILFSPNEHCMKWLKGMSDGLCKQRIVEHIATSLQ